MCLSKAATACFNVCRYKHDRRQRKVSFPKLVYWFSARQVQHINVEKQKYRRSPWPIYRALRSHRWPNRNAPHRSLPTGHLPEPFGPGAHHPRSIRVWFPHLSLFRPVYTACLTAPDPSLRARQICAPTEPSMSDDLQHWQYETFKAHWRDRTIGHLLAEPRWEHQQREAGCCVSTG